MAVENSFLPMDRNRPSKDGGGGTCRHVDGLRQVHVINLPIRRILPTRAIAYYIKLSIVVAMSKSSMERHWSDEELDRKDVVAWLVDCEL